MRPTPLVVARPLRTRAPAANSRVMPAADSRELDRSASRPLAAPTARGLASRPEPSRTSSSTGRPAQPTWQLPFVKSSVVGPIDIIRRPQATDTTLLSNSRLYGEAEIRVLLADDISQLHPERGAGVLDAERRSTGTPSTTTQTSGTPNTTTCTTAWAKLVPTVELVPARCRCAAARGLCSDKSPWRPLAQAFGCGSSI